MPLPAIGRSEYPAVGVVAVMMGALISTLNARLTTQGLADIRGALGLGFDDGSWISTIFSAAQMVVTPAAAWMGTVLSTRRVLLWTGAIFALASLPPPLVHDYDTLIGLQFVRGSRSAPSFPRHSASSYAAWPRNGGSGALPPTRSASSFRRISAVR
jgi:DHA2 family multidrug resistance protein